MAGACAFGAPTMDEDDGKYVIDVPAGETYALTADDVAAIGTLPLVKAGEGTLTVNDVLKDYTGDIYVTNGTTGAVERRAGICGGREVLHLRRRLQSTGCDPADIQGVLSLWRQDHAYRADAHLRHQPPGLPL